MKKHILLLIIILTVGFASVSVNLILSGKTSVAFDKEKLQVIFTRVRLNNEESENVIITDEGKSFVYIADNLTNVGDTSIIEYDIKNQSSNYDASIVVSCTTDNSENIEYNGNTLNQLIEIKASEGYTDTLTTKLTKVNTSSNSLALKCTLIVNPLERDTIMLGKEYNVTFDANGGNIIDSGIIVNYYEKYGELPIPTKEEYDFLGWYTEDGEKIDASSIVRIKDNHTLLAKWKKRLYQLINDVNKNGIADIGDEIKVGTESFYVISHTDTELKALAKYNLKVGNICSSDGTLESTISTSEERYGRQDALMRGWVYNKKIYGTVAFSNQSGWEKGKSIDIRNEPYGNGPVKEALYGENGYENYIKQTIKDANIRLITKNELESLGCSDRSCTSALSWVYSTSYWTQSASSDYVSNVWRVNSNGEFVDSSFDHIDNFGVRPVIIITADLNVFNITFDANGGNEIDINKEIKYEKEYGELPIPIHNNADYTFAGWYTEKGEKIESTTIMNKYKDHELIARWKTNYGYEIINDVNKDGIVDIGDEICVGSENFYVISHTDTELNALAKYNLKVGNIYTSGGSKETTIQTTEEGYGRQDPQMRGYVNGEKRYGTIEFSKAKGWTYANNATIDIRNETYRVGSGVTSETMTTLDALYTSNEVTGIKGYEEYIQETIPDSKVRLITKGEIEALVNDGNELSSGSIKDKAYAKGYPWLYSTAYWTQSASSDASNIVWRMNSYGQFVNSGFNHEDLFGARPVITIPLS